MCSHYPPSPPIRNSAFSDIPRSIHGLGLVGGGILHRPLCPFKHRSARDHSDGQHPGRRLLGFLGDDGLSNGYWSQVGYYICASAVPIAFYQKWNLNTNTVLTSGSNSVSVGTHEFSMYLLTGTTWTYALDGSVFGVYDMGASTSSSTHPVYALSEEQADNVFPIPKVTFSDGDAGVEIWNLELSAECPVLRARLGSGGSVTGERAQVTGSWLAEPSHHTS